MKKRSDGSSSETPPGGLKRLGLLGVLILAACVFAADALSPDTLARGRWAHPPAVQGGDAEKTPPASVRSAWPPAAQSQEYRLAAGETLIISLPETLRDRAWGERAVEAYAPLRTPALSELAGRSFAWRTRPQDTGRHRILLEALYEDAPTDTLTLDVTVE